MFPTPRTTASTPLQRSGLRSRLVRGLDLAVEFATLGEYGVEEVELVGELSPGSGWDWPQRPSTCCEGGRPERLSARSPHRSRERGGAVRPAPQGCA